MTVSPASVSVAGGARPAFDSRAALLLVTAGMIAAFAAGPVAGTFLSVGLLAEALRQARHEAARRTLALALAAFVLGGVVNVLFVRTGATVWTFPVLGAGITEGGLREGLRIGLRMANLVLLGGVALRRMDVIEWVDALTALTSPAARVFGGRVHALLFQLRLAVAFVPGIRTEASRVLASQRRRGLRLDGSLSQRARLLLPLFVPVWVGAMVRASRTGVVLAARGVQPHRPLRPRVGPWRTSDTLVVLGAALGAAAVLRWG